MLTVNNVSLQFGKRVLFDDVNVKFTKGNCYGVIGANGAGKSTFLKILSGEIDSTTGSVDLESSTRLSFLRQDHNAFDEFPVLETVIMGHKALYDIMKEKDALYMKPDFSEEDGIKVGELEAEFAEMDGWNAESDAAAFLSNLGVKESKHDLTMKELNGNEKVRVLLAQALFGNPDVLLLDEPTNDLDSQTIAWLENFLADYKNTVIVVSHDRHFLDVVCTHIADIDFQKLQLYSGNYSFWYESSQLILKQRSNKNKKNEDKIKELQDFISRFSANASKSKQATSRKKALDKIKLDEIKPSTRKYPAIIFNPERAAGDQILEVKDLSYTENGVSLFSDVSFTLEKNDKIGILSKDSRIADCFYEVIMGEKEATTGSYEWGVTITPSYIPHDNTKYFDTDNSLIDWLREYSPNKDEAFVRGFLGKMLFTGEESLKSARVLSGGEKVRCMLSRMMLQAGNVLLLNEPTHHLDLESITALNNSLKGFESTMFVTSHDHELMQTTCNRIIELGPNGIIDKTFTTYDEYLAMEDLEERRASIYEGLVVQE